MSKRELRALLGDADLKDAGSASKGRTRRQTSRLRAFEDLSQRTMNAEGGAGSAVPELQRRLQELERRLTSAEAESRKKDEAFETAHDEAATAIEPWKEESKKSRG